MTRILCAVDFSDVSRHALNHAVALARSRPAALTVQHVRRMPLPLVGIGPYVEPVSPVALTAAERTSLAGMLNELAAPGRAAGVPIDTILDEDVNVPGAILDRAARLSADTIVLGTHGRSGVGRLTLGSVAEKVLRAARCPVLTVPPLAGDADPAEIQRIVCPIDFSPGSAAALEQAASLAAGTHARLTVVHVVELPPELPDLPIPEFSAYREALFERSCGTLKEAIPDRIRALCPVDTLLFVGRPYREILRLAREQQADLIVMGVHGRGAVDLFFFGSTTNQVVRQAPCPVLTVPVP